MSHPTEVLCWKHQGLVSWQRCRACLDSESEAKLTVKYPVPSPDELTVKEHCQGYVLEKLTYNKNAVTCSMCSYVQQCLFGTVMRVAEKLGGHCAGELQTTNKA